jgi:hypothetical protein
VIWWLALLACGPDDVSEECIHDPPLEYDRYGQGFVEKFCNGCHSSLVPEELRNDAPVGVDFDSYGAILQWKDRIAVRTDPDEPTMPPGGGPTDDQYVEFHEWLDCSVQRDWDAVYGGD